MIFEECVPDGLVQFNLRGNSAGVPLFIHPLDGKGVSLGKAAHLWYFMIRSYQHVRHLDEELDARETFADQGE